jgi:hypothetical protein
MEEVPFLASGDADVVINNHIPYIQAPTEHCSTQHRPGSGPASDPSSEWGCFNVHSIERNFLAKPEYLLFEVNFPRGAVSARSLKLRSASQYTFQNASGTR